MIASSLALRLMMVEGRPRDLDATRSLSPIVSYRRRSRHDGFKSRVLAQQDFPEQAVLPQLDGLQPYQFEQRQEHRDQRLPRIRIPQELLQAKRLVFERQPTPQVFDHLRHRDAFLIHLDDGPRARAVEDLLKGLDQIDD